MPQPPRPTPSQQRALEELQQLRRTHRGLAPPRSQELAPDSWPPERKEGQGNPHIEPPKPKAHNATIIGIWGIIATFGAAAGAGYIASTTVHDRVTQATYEADKVKRDAHDVSVAETLTNLRLDVARLQERLGVINEPKPLAPSEPKQQVKR